MILKILIVIYHQKRTERHKKGTNRLKLSKIHYRQKKVDAFSTHPLSYII